MEGCTLFSDLDRSCHKFENLLNLKGDKSWKIRQEIERLLEIMLCEHARRVRNAMRVIMYA